jgi:tRNA/tmRNA/rRNA uracil-C5-methylase (TrmA/RlmC/RlmD family)
MSRKLKNQVLENLLVERIAAEGKSVAHYEGKVVFIPNVAPGDVVDVRITRGKSSFMEGDPIKFHQFSEDRVAPFCEHFGVCGAVNGSISATKPSSHLKDSKSWINLKGLPKYLYRKSDLL